MISSIPMKKAAACCHMVECKRNETSRDESVKHTINVLVGTASDRELTKIAENIDQMNKFRSICP